MNNEENLILVDVDDNKQVILVDNTTNYLLATKHSFFNRLTLLSNNDNVYILECKSLAKYQKIISELNRYNLPFSESVNALAFKDNLQTDSLITRINLCKQIKDNHDLSLTNQNFLDFKNIIDNETTVHLKEQQLINAYHHVLLRNAMDFSVPGTGKTFISYGMFIYLYKLGEVNKLIVIGPLNCFKAWKNEREKIFGNKHQFNVFDCSEHKNDYKTVINTDKDLTIYLFNYEFFQNEGKVKFLSNNLFDNKCMVVFDEIHRMKGETAKRAQNIIQLIKNSNHRPKYELALTGTPLPNSYCDLANYLQVLFPDDVNQELPALTSVNLNAADNNRMIANDVQHTMYALFTRTTKKDLNVPIANPDDLTSLSASASQLQQQIIDLIIRKCKNNPFISFIFQIEASSNPLLLLNKVSNDDLEAIVEDKTITNELQNLQTISFNEEEKQLIKAIGTTPKMQKTIDLIVDKVKENKSVIVWCLFIGTINLLREKLNELGISAISVDGQDKNLQFRDKKIDAFKNKQVMVLITNPNTLAESVSLHETCHDAIYLEYGFNLTYLLQSKDRIHRVGLLPGTQTNYYFAITKSLNNTKSIDELIYERLKLKANRMDKVISSHELVLIKENNEKDDIDQVINEEQDQ